MEPCVNKKELGCVDEKKKTGPFLTRHTWTPRGDALDEVKRYVFALVQIGNKNESHNVIIFHSACQAMSGKMCSSNSVAQVQNNSTSESC